MKKRCVAIPHSVSLLCSLFFALLVMCGTTTTTSAFAPAPGFTIFSARQQQQQRKHSVSILVRQSASSDKNEKSRSERIQEETAKAKSMSIGDLRKELTARGIKHSSFFEKSEFVKAYAEAIVDGVKASASSNSSSAGSRSSSSSRRQEETYDPSYRDVQMRKLDPSTKRMLQGTVIDIRPKS